MIGPFYLNFVYVGNRVFSTQQYLDYSCFCVIPLRINLMSASLVQDALYNFFLQMNVFLWISIIGSYYNVPSSSIVDMMKFQNSTEVNQGKHKISNFVLLSNEENLEFRKSKSQNISLLQLYDLLNTNYLKLK